MFFSPVAAWLPSVDVLKIAVAGKPCCYEGAALLIKFFARPQHRVAAWLPSVDALKIAVAGKPCCYGGRRC